MKTFYATFLTSLKGKVAVNMLKVTDFKVTYTRSQGLRGQLYFFYYFKVDLFSVKNLITDP